MLALHLGDSFALPVVAIPLMKDGKQIGEVRNLRWEGNLRQEGNNIVGDIIHWEDSEDAKPDHVIGVDPAGNAGGGETATQATDPYTGIVQWPPAGW